MCFLPCLNLIPVLHEEVDIVQSVLQTMFLITVYLEMLTVPGGKVCDGLVGQINAHLCLVVFVDAVEEFFEESLRDDDRQHKVVELIVLVDIRKERTDDHPETVACASLKSGLLSTKSFFSEPSALKRQSWKR